MRKINFNLIIFLSLFFVSNIQGAIFFGSDRGKIYRYSKNRLSIVNQTTKFDNFYKLGISKQVFYGFSQKQGLYVSFDKGSTWFKRTPEIATGNQLVSFGVDKSRATWVVATKHKLYLSLDKGRSWKDLPGPAYCSFNTFIDLKFDRNKSSCLYLATAYNGVHWLKVSKKRLRWKSFSRNWFGWVLSKGSYSYETVSSLVQELGGKIWGITPFGKIGYYNGRRWVKQSSGTGIKNVRSFFEKGDGFLIDSATEGLFTWNKKNKIKSQPFKFEPYLKRGPKGEGISSLMVKEVAGIFFVKQFVNPVSWRNRRFWQIAYDKRLRMKLAANRQSIYIYLPLYKRESSFRAIIKKAKLAGVNGVVIDMKDDNGRILYDSKLPLVKKMKARKRLINLQKYLSILRENKIYSIARIVVFKDSCLFRYKNYKYAVRDKYNKRPWVGGINFKEYWVDPYSQFVQDYNISVGKELANLGFDEIQFDYIRFPTDGPVYRATYSYRKNEINKSLAIANFLKKARELIRKPISVDVYGFNGWYLNGAKQGQDIDLISRFVDVICPMYYPSHFGRLFMMQDEEKIIREGVLRAKLFSGNRALIRPYLQAFRIFAPDYGSKYIKNQILGNSVAGGSGYIFWNMRGRYREVFSGMQKIKK